MRDDVLVGGEGEQVLGRVTRGSLDRPIGIPRPDRTLSRVTMVCTEFTSRCPVTDQPDFGTVEISFTPREKIVESKSLKLYLLKFRESGVFCESLACQIAQEVFEVIEPDDILVTVTQLPRGGISIIAESRLERRAEGSWYVPFEETEFVPMKESLHG